MKKFRLVRTVVAIALAVSTLSMTAFAKSWTWTSSDQWGSWTNNGYTLYNDIWGSGAGSQTISANSYSDWQVYATHPATSGIKSYPNVTKTIGTAINSLNTCTSSFNVSVPTSNVSYETAYDIWCGGSSYEIMLWENYYGSVGPISYTYGSNGSATPVYSNVSVGGSTWNIYVGNNGSNMVYSFLRTSKTTSGTVDIKAILKYLQGKGYFGNVTLTSVQFGYELTSCASGATFVTKSYSVTKS
jgi:hypothetical protein